MPVNAITIWNTNQLAKKPLRKISPDALLIKQKIILSILLVICMTIIASNSFGNIRMTYIIPFRGYAQPGNC